MPETVILLGLLDDGGLFLGIPVSIRLDDGGLSLPGILDNGGLLPEIPIGIPNDGGLLAKFGVFLFGIAIDVGLFEIVCVVLIVPLETPLFAFKFVISLRREVTRFCKCPTSFQPASS